MQKFNLPEELTIYTAASCQEELFDLLTAKEDIKLICRELTEIDAAGIQLLLSLKKTTFQEDFSLQLTNVSSEVEEIFAVAGIRDLLIGGNNNG
jgi:anti-anti-sigma factor